MSGFRTDYKNDKLLTASNRKRKFKVIENDDGTVSFDDVTAYEQRGNGFGADEVNAIHRDLNDYEADLKRANEDIGVERERINNLARAEESGMSTDAERELLDIRVGANGKPYTNAGDAVRSQFEQLSSEIGCISDKQEEYLKLSDVKFSIGSINNKGELKDRKDRIATDFILVRSSSEISIDDGYQFNVAMYEFPKEASFSGYYEMSDAVRVIDHDCYIRICIKDDAETQWTTETMVEPISALNLGEIITRTKIECLVDCNHEFSDGFIDTSGEIGSVVKLEAEESTSWIHAVIACNKGDVYEFGGKGGRKPRLWCVVDSGNAIIYNAGESESSEKITFLAPYSCKLIVNVNSMEGDAYIKKLVSVGNAIEKMESTMKDDEVKVEQMESALKNDIHISKSIFHRNTDFAPATICGYYNGLCDDYSMFNLNTTYSEFMNEWDALVSEYGEYITKTELGSASDGQMLYSYRFNPKRFGLAKNKKRIPKIIIIGGQHGFEKSNVFGLYYLIKDMLKNWKKDSVLDYLRHHVELIIIPIVNPWGFDNRNRLNANSVNINRNYDCNWIADGEGTEYGGAAPFDQVETQIVRDLVLNNLDAVYFMDSHTCGGNAVGLNSDVNWHSFSDCSDVMYREIMQAAEYHLANLTAHFEHDYNLLLPTHDNMCGRITSEKGNGLSKSWVTEQGIIGSTVEGFNGFVDGEKCTSEVKKANSEIIANWLIAVINTLKCIL